MAAALIAVTVKLRDRSIFVRELPRLFPQHLETVDGENRETFREARKLSY